MVELIDSLAKRILEMEISLATAGKVFWKSGLERRPEEEESYCSHDHFEYAGCVCGSVYGYPASKISLGPL